MQLYLMRHAGGASEYGADREVRDEAAHAGETGECVLVDALVAVVVGDDDSEEIVAFAGHQMAVLYFPAQRDGAFELGHGFAALVFECDGDEHSGAAAKRFLGEDGRIAFDDARGLHGFDTAVAGGRAEADALCESGGGEDAVAFEFDQYLMVEIVELDGNFLRHGTVYAEK
jgi:hypothetical protein